MLKKEKKRAQDAAAQLAGITTDQRVSPQGASRVSTTPLLKEGSMDTVSAHHVGQAIQHMQKGPQLSMGKKEAFEIFIRDHEDHPTIEDNKNLLKQRSAETRGLREQLNESRTTITELKNQLETRRRQRAAHGVMGNCTDSEEYDDPVEENLCKRIEQEKVAYKSTIDHLKALRTEIEHLQLLLERAKIKLHKDFHKWWSQEASSVQESESGATARCHMGSPNGTLQPSSPGTPGFSAPALSSTMRDSPAGQDPNPDCPTSSDPKISITPRSVPAVQAIPVWNSTSLDGKVPDSIPSSEWRALTSTTISSSSIPMTGDQQTDADILAFVRARQSLLSKAGPPQQ